MLMGCNESGGTVQEKSMQTEDNDKLEKYLDSTHIVPEEIEDSRIEELVDAYTTQSIWLLDYDGRHPRNTTLSDCLLIYIPNRRSPIICENMSELILGHSIDAKETIPLLDLTQYQAVNLGVSRRHARISHNEKCYFIEDLDSTNGTWLNSKKISPLQRFQIQRGDRIRLGQLAMIIG
jgi:hypothetical protein